MDEDDLPSWARGTRWAPIIGRITDDGVVVLRGLPPPAPEDEPEDPPEEE